MFQQTCTTHLWLIHIFRWCHMGKLSFFAIQKYIYALLTACVPMQSVAQWDCDFASNFQKPHMCCIANDGLETVALMKHGKFSNQQKRILNGIFTLHVPKMWHSVSNSLNVCIYIYRYTLICIGYHTAVVRHGTLSWWISSRKASCSACASTNLVPRASWLSIWIQIIIFPRKFSENLHQVSKNNNFKQCNMFAICWSSPY